MSSQSQKLLKVHIGKTSQLSRDMKRFQLWDHLEAMLHTKSYLAQSLCLGRRIGGPYVEALATLFKGQTL
jgi:hypothetical protein